MQPLFYNINDFSIISMISLVKQVKSGKSPHSDNLVLCHVELVDPTYVGHMTEFQVDGCVMNNFDELLG